MRNKKNFILAVLIVSLIIICAGCSKSGTPASSLPETQSPAETESPAASETPEPENTPMPEPSPAETQAPVKLSETEDMGQEYQDKIVFYGDSNTNRLRLTEILPGAYRTGQIWTPMSGTLTLSFWNTTTVVYPETWTEMHVTEAMKLKKPEYLLINLGSNGISFMDETAFKNEYRKMVTALKEANPETKIMLSGLYPVANSYPYQKDINNNKIAAANEWIYSLAEETGTRYIDSGEALRAADNSLPEDMHTGDGYHLSKQSLELVLKYIRTHAYQ